MRRRGKHRAGDRPICLFAGVEAGEPRWLASWDPTRIGDRDVEIALRAARTVAEEIAARRRAMEPKGLEVRHERRRRPAPARGERWWTVLRWPPFEGARYVLVEVRSRLPDPEGRTKRARVLRGCATEVEFRGLWDSGAVRRIEADGVRAGWIEAAAG